MDALEMICYKSAFVNMLTITGKRTCFPLFNGQSSANLIKDYALFYFQLSSWFKIGKGKAQMTVNEQIGRISLFK